MTKPFPAEDFIAARETAIATKRESRGQYGRTFDLHPALYALTFGGYMTFIAIMGVAFADPELAIPLAIFAVFVVGFFGTPALWARIAPPPPGAAPSWATFLREGFECLTGHVSARGAMVQILIMPALLLFWAVAVGLIAAWAL